MTDAMTETTLAPTPKAPLIRLPTPVLILLPLVLLIAVLILIVKTDGGLSERTLPPIETLTIERVTLPEPGMITVDLINDGPDEVSIAQVLVDDAYWQFTSSSDGPLGRLDRATLEIPYPWVQDEAHSHPDPDLDRCRVRGRDSGRV